MGLFTSAAQTAFFMRSSNSHVTFVTSVPGDPRDERDVCLRTRQHALKVCRTLNDQLSPTSIKHTLQSAAPIESVRVQGWVRTRRDSKDFSFIELNDGSSLRSLQIIAKRDALPN